jgi:Tol biopolymer transport system component
MRWGRPLAAASIVVVAALAVPGAGRPSAPARLGLLALVGDLRPTLIPRVYALDVRDRTRTDLAFSESGWDPALSPDHRRLAFVSARDGFQSIYVARPDGSDPRRLTHEIDGTAPFLGRCPADESNPDWSPDGRQIAFELVVGAECSPPRAAARRLSAAGYTVPLPHRLALVNADGSGLRVLDVDGYLPRWSPDGTRIAYVERSPEALSPAPGKTSGIIRLDDGSSRSLGPGTAPAWAPDGGTLALPTGRGSVAVFDADGRFLRSVRGAGAGWTRCGLVVSRSGAVAISPDRRTAAFRRAGRVVERPCGGRSRVVADGSWRPISFAPIGGRLLLGRCGHGRCALAVAGTARLVEIGRRTAGRVPAWSPDGRRVAFLGAGGALDVAETSTGRTATVAVEGSGCDVTPPVWSGDATLVYGSRAIGPESNLYMLDLTNGTARLAAHAAWDPAWSPDGKTLAYRTPSGIWLTSSTVGARRPRLLRRASTAGIAWSPDGTQLAYSNGARLLLVDHAGSVRPVIGPIEGIALAAWSPDSRWLAYRVPAWRADPGIWLVHPDGSGNHLFIPQASDLVWSPDGTRIAYIESSGAWGSRLWVADASGAAAAPLPGEFGTTLSWPTATGILALRPSEPPANSGLGLPPFGQVVLVAPDGSGETPLTSASTSVLAAAWQPLP